MNQGGRSSESGSDAYLAPSSRRRSSKNESALEPKDGDVLRRIALWAQIAGPAAMIFFVIAAWFNISAQVDSNTKALTRMDPVIEEAKLLHPQIRENKATNIEHREVLDQVRLTGMHTALNIRLIMHKLGIQGVQDPIKTSAP